ncbi:hypothetical protein GQ53DRAFT_264931 [Thozetella sp. PMI_491]|nr:hypothetical protein GQ53DRAFT_264931 [Thozetella sp. PMI_491]
MRLPPPMPAVLAVVITITTPAGCLSDPPTVSDYHQRVDHTVARLGDFIYVDGGAVEQRSTSTLAPGLVPENVTFSIPLRSAWTNLSVQLGTVTKAGAPKLLDESLWIDDKKQSLYAWSDLSQATDGIYNDTRLWRLTADGAGGGFWQPQDSVDAQDMLSLQRTAGAGSTTCYNTGFHLGGSAADPDKPMDSPLLVPGLTTYNITSNKWANISATAFTPRGTFFNGEAVCLPTFGPSGLVIFLGGLTSFGDNWQSTGDSLSHSAGNGFDNLTFYDPFAERWYSQIATGSRPTPRSLFCAAGVQGPNNTFEIYLYGGFEIGTLKQVGDLYVLSLPGFVWFKSNLTTAPVRARHKCVASGDSQMISIGGWVDPVPDVWPQGLGVFDLPSLSLKSSYDPESGVYDSPQAVKEWYSKGGLDLVQWSSEAVKSLFITSKSSSSSLPLSQSSSLPTSSSSSLSLPQSSDTSPNSNSISSDPILVPGAIAGIVVGGVAVLAVLSGWAWVAWKRREARKFTGTPDESLVEPDHYKVPEILVEIEQPQYPVEMTGTELCFELEAYSLQRDKQSY